MIGLGTLINTIAILAGGIFGNLFGHLLTNKIQEGLLKASGVAVIFIGISGALPGLLTIESQQLNSGNSMLVVISLTIGCLIGELLDIEGQFEKFGQWLKQKTGNSKDSQFITAFVTASLTVCIGAMAIVGAINDGILGDHTILATKSILDFIIILVMATSLGKGATFSAIPVFLFEGSITLLARLLQPLMTTAALANISLIGSILIFCVGINLI
ncbi:putative membrane protein YqgA involved in biofilm formation [Streptococcus loxodontisalivarius]|uniref:Membrane protein YqgA involved in biofilm formation n=1 Tax=Streptococcus loxodontisalivarius TaxID=1349415 RepID=A0ABS2PTK8_9STRE|nr:putative membrane protein YqgA involved in biofilm formation [Streptococcus loxodontisalivarius]